MHVDFKLLLIVVEGAETPTGEAEQVRQLRHEVSKWLRRSWVERKVPWKSTTKFNKVIKKNEEYKMKTIYDIQQYLKKFGILIYIGDRISDLELMESEIHELYRAQLMDVRDYQSAVLLLRHEIQLLKNHKK